MVALKKVNILKKILIIVLLLSTPTITKAQDDCNTDFELCEVDPEVPLDSEVILLVVLGLAIGTLAVKKRIESGIKSVRQ